MKRKSSFTIVIILLTISAIFISDKFLNFGLASRITDIIKPVSAVVQDFGEGIVKVFGNIGNIGNLQKENADLKSQLNQAQAQIAKMSEAENENESLKRDLDFKTQNNFELISADIISFDPSNIRSTILINAGKKNGIAVGDVVVSEGFLVGKISEVSDGTAKIRLISDPLSVVPANMMNTGINGIVKGTIGNGLTMEQVPQSEKINQNDYVTTSGLGGDFPSGIIIGQVGDIQKISGSIFQSITINPKAKLNQLERVMVIRK